MDEASRLAELRHHWGEAYRITSAGPASWSAARLDGKGALRADTPDLLLDMIRADYGLVPVPREAKAPKVSRRGRMAQARREAKR